MSFILKDSDWSLIYNNIKWNNALILVTTGIFPVYRFPEYTFISVSPSHYFTKMAFNIDAVPLVESSKSLHLIVI